jgi:hypothetical protein
MFNEYPYKNLSDLNLDWFLNKFKGLLTTLDGLVEWKNDHEQEYEDLKRAVDDLESGNWTPEFVNTLINWYRDHIIDIIGEMVKQVFFGITDDGYFVAYIPESWDDIIFGTSGFDDFPAGIDYGHLTLSY